MKKSLILVLLAVAGSYGIATAQMPAVQISDKTGWHKIGETTVDLQKERDEVAVIGADRFAALKIRVTDAPVELTDLEIYFEDDTRQNVQLRTMMKAGAESRIINIEGGEKDLEKIVFLYKSTANASDEKASIEIWGKKTNEDNNTAGDDRNMNNGDNRYKDKEKDNRTDMGATRPNWSRIGEKTVDFSKEYDEIIMPGASRYSAIKFSVAGASVDISDMEIHYADGGKDDINVASPIRPGGESRSIEVKGNDKDIKKIVFRYKTMDNNRQKATVTVWGMRMYKDTEERMRSSDDRKMNDNRTADNRNDNAKDKDGVKAKDDSHGAIAKPSVVWSDKKGWTKIAENTVDLKMEKDEVAVIGADKFAAIKFKATDANIQLMDVHVHYHDGTQQDISAKTPMNEGKETKVFELKGSDKDIKTISFTYKTMPNQGKDKAHIEIWGVKSDLASE